ncbi:MAG TPA: hypothetical protein VIK86_01225 [Candidatus Paceibacterota bacterium]
MKKLITLILILISLSSFAQPLIHPKNENIKCMQKDTSKFNEIIPNLQLVAWTDTTITGYATIYRIYRIANPTESIRTLINAGKAKVIGGTSGSTIDTTSLSNRINNKVDKDGGKVLSDNNFADSCFSKLYSSTSTDTALINHIVSDTANVIGFSRIMEVDTVTSRGAVFGRDLIVNDITIGKGNNSISSNTAIGSSSLYNITNGDYNTGVGYASLAGTTTGKYNTAVGHGSSGNISTGQSNTSLGYSSLSTLTILRYNTAIGAQSLQWIKGQNNTSVGYKSGAYISTGVTKNDSSLNCVFIGSETRPLANNDNNEIIIGTTLTGNGSNTVTIGNSLITANYFNGTILGSNIDATNKTDISSKQNRSDTNTTGNPITLSYFNNHASSFDSTSLSNRIIQNQFWTPISGTPTRATSTTFTITGDYSWFIAKGLIIKWTESSTVRCAMVSIPSTFGSPNTTVTIIGDTIVSGGFDAGSVKYCKVGAEKVRFAIVGTIGATGTDIANAYYATEPMRVLGADLQTGVYGTTNNCTVDINNSGPTMFKVKPTLATTVAASPLPFTANTYTSLTLNSKVTLDIDAIHTTPNIDLYVQLYVFPSRYLNIP